MLSAQEFESEQPNWEARARDALATLKDSTPAQFKLKWPLGGGHDRRAAAGRPRRVVSQTGLACGGRA